MSRVITSVLIGAIIIFVGWAYFSNRSASRREDTDPEAHLRTTVSAVTSGQAASLEVAGPSAVSIMSSLGVSSELKPIRTWSDQSHVQSIMLTYPPSKVEVIDSKPDPVSGQWLTASYVGTAPFRLSDAAAAQKDLFAIAGWSHRIDNEFVLERWALVNQTTQEPLPLFPPKVFVRTEIFRGVVAGDFHGLEFDAEGRFIYVLLGDETSATLFKFANVADTNSQAVATSSAYPELLSVRHIQKFEHVTMGRQLQCVLMPSFSSLVFVDTNNDGTFDGTPIFGSIDDLTSSGVIGLNVQNPLRGPTY